MPPSPGHSPDVTLTDAQADRLMFAEFVSAVELARPCFLDLVASGDLDDTDLPLEITHADCLAGRNWYVADDPEYVEGFWQCVDAGAAAASG